MEDEKKIETILAKLNKGLIAKKWAAADGFHYMPVAYPPNPGGGLATRFDTNVGIIVKTFVHNDTGEVKVFYFRSVIK